MTDLYAMFKTDSDKEKAGFWYEFTPDVKFKLARAGGANMKFAKCVEAKTRPHRRKIDNGTIDPELAHSLLVDAYAEAIVLDWDGVTDSKGKKLTFSKQNVVKLLTDLPDLFHELSKQASALDNFLADEIAEDAGN